MFMKLNINILVFCNIKLMYAKRTNLKMDRIGEIKF